MKWEYRTMSIPWTEDKRVEVTHYNNIDIVLKILGQDGWELVTVTDRYNFAHIFYFKRPIAED